ncbi:MAG: aminomethyl transferase family protein [Desulfobacterium sp.]|nr:aminomethyl transferase family protein [Desulfobacterium sp.]
MSADDLKTTPLNAWHRANNANMAGFGGYDMPLWYGSGVKKEHLAVLESAGLFDTSHMACVMVKGTDALELLQFCITRELSDLKNGRCAYGAILNDKGHVVDDAIVYRFGQGSFMVCVNAGMGDKVSDHLGANKGRMNLEIENLSDRLAKIDIQGRNSARILSKLLKTPDSVFTAMPYFSFKGSLHHGGADPVLLKDGTNILLSRSGYTGEFGFEIFADSGAGVSIWEQLLNAGREYNLTPCGLAARDSLRVGSVLPLSHQDIGNMPYINHPWMVALPLDQDGKTFTKDFLGRDALEAANDADFTHAFVGEDLRKVGSGPDTQVIDAKGKMIGSVLTCVTDMGIGWHDGKIYSITSPDLPVDFKAKGISCGFILADHKLEEGEKLTLQEGKRKIKVTVVKDIRPHRTAKLKLTNFI